MGRKKMFASSAKAERNLGFHIVSVDDALRRAIRWFQAHGYVEIAGNMATARA
jgi:dihydroflavonol-4-reductase